MTLQKLNLKFCYRSDKDNIIEDFYYKALKEACVYQRAVGYFSTQSLLLLENGLDLFIENGGKIFLIASPQLSEDDINLIQNGYENREEILKKLVLDSLYIPEDDDEIKSLSRIERLIALGNLEIKIAFNQKCGIFHEKIGIITDCIGNKIAFTGSLNETCNALKNNFESIDLYFSWDNRDFCRIIEKQKDFDDLWNNNTKGIEVFDFSVAIKNKLISYKKQGKIPYLDDELKEKNEPFIPNSISIRDYQKVAYENWKNNNYKGILEMATGTGKTITACYSLVNLYNYLIENDKKQIVIVLVPYKHLVNQWSKELDNFGYNPYKVFSDVNWYKKIESQIMRLNMSSKLKHLCIVTTNDSFKTDKFKKLLTSMTKRFNVVLVADEVHNVGANDMIKCLPTNGIDYTLGLSATPARHNDEDGTRKIIKYFGDVIFKFSLKDAIEKGFLTKYYYYPYLVYLDKNESINYYNLINEFNGYPIQELKKIVATNTKLKNVIKMSYEISDGSINKFIKFKEIISKFKNEYFNLVYCSSVSINNGENKLPIKQIDAITAYMGNILRMRVHPFTASEDSNLRKNLLDRFSSGDDLQSLIAIKCLDEGVDVPATRRAFILSSTTNEKQFIQRRGRVLRKFPGKDYSEIYDFITLPRNLDDFDGGKNIFSTEIFLVAKEYKRLIEFSKLAVNSEMGLEIANKIKKIYTDIESGVINE